MPHLVAANEPLITGDFPLASGGDGIYNGLYGNGSTLDVALRISMTETSLPSPFAASLAAADLVLVRLI